MHTSLLTDMKNNEDIKNENMNENKNEAKQDPRVRSMHMKR